MNEISLEELLAVIEDTDYYPLFRPLLGYEDFIKFYEGIDDSMEHLLDEVQDLVGFEFPGDLIHVLLMTNGAKFFDLTLYQLTEDDNDKNGLYYNNATAPTRKEFNIPENYLIVGKSSDLFVVCATLDEEGYLSYVLWDTKNKEAGIVYDYLVEVIMAEIDYYTGAFSEGEDDEE